MSIFIFIVVIVSLIVVHEFGHFVAAKLSGMRVDEFGLGYPPRAVTIAKVGGTTYTLNWLPFGGFVKIYGEDSSTDSTCSPQAELWMPNSFSSKTRFAQAMVLVAGIAMNLFFAYVLIAVDPQSFSAFINANRGNAVTLNVKHDGHLVSIMATPKEGIVATDPFRFALGVEVATVGVVPLSLGEAITEGASLTWGAIQLTAIGLLHFFYSVFTLSANFSQVAGPIGIAGVVGSASAQGFGNLLSIMAIISINLALINLIPIPALDGGRLLFVGIESVIRRPIKPSIAHAINAIGFVFLILLMLVVTAHDIFKIVG